MNIFKRFSKPFNKKKEKPIIIPHAESSKGGQEIKEIPRDIPKKVLVVKRNCRTCKGTGEVSWDEGKTKQQCLCCKIKDNFSRKWSRNYWKEIKVLTHKRIITKVASSNKDTEAIEVK